MGRLPRLGTKAVIVAFWMYRTTVPQVEYAGCMSTFEPAPSTTNVHFNFCAYLSGHRSRHTRMWSLLALGWRLWTW